MANLSDKFLISNVSSDPHYFAGSGEDQNPGEATPIPNIYLFQGSSVLATLLQRRVMQLDETGIISASVRKQSGTVNFSEISPR